MYQLTFRWCSATVLGRGAYISLLVHRPQGTNEPGLDLMGFKLEEMAGLAFVLFPLAGKGGLEYFLQLERRGQKTI